MASPFTPQRRRGIEYLDEAGIQAAVAERSLRDVALSNLLFGGARAVVSEVTAALAQGRLRRATVLDIGTGLGDIPARLRAAAARHGIVLVPCGLDANPALARRAAREGFPVACARVPPLPIRDRAVDIVICSQLLHHLDAAAAAALLREMNRVARSWVIVSDLRRSWAAVTGIWLASFPLRFHPVSRHDGVLSVLRGFTPGELRGAVRGAVGAMPRVRRHALFRLTAAWTPAGRPS